MTLDEIAGEFLDRHRKGDKPSVDEYAERFPELADEIRQTLPAVAMMEEFGPGSEDLSSDGRSALSLLEDMAVPSQIGDYRILGEIGRGGMGVVYEAEQQSLGRRVALKVLPYGSAQNGNALVRFEREARSAARLHHTNIVPVFDVGHEGDNAFYAMQLIQGQSLAAVIDDLKQLRDESTGPRPDADPGASPGPAPWRTSPGRSVVGPPSRELAALVLSGTFRAEDLAESPEAPTVVDVDIAAAREPAGSGADEGCDEVSTSSSVYSAVLPGTGDISTAESDRHRFYRSVAQIGLQTAQALSSAHARGIIHRDIKPSNLLLDIAGVVWITDFGLAKTEAPDITQAGDILGTIRYMAPERFKGQSDARSDIYALGLTLYELVALKPAFDALDRLKLIRTITTEEPAQPRSIDAGVPQDLETIILKTIEKDPKSRYASADDLAEDLQRFINDEPIKARRVSPLEHLSRWARRNRGLAASLSAVVLLLVLLAVGSTVAAVYFRLQQEIQQRLADDKQAEATRAIAAEATAKEEHREAVQARDRADAARKTIRRNLYTAQMNSAGYEAMRPEGISKVLRLTEAWIPKAGEKDLRGWEWYYLRSLSHTAQLTLPGRHLFLKSARWSPDGTRLACLTGDRLETTVVVWDAISGRRLLETPVEVEGRRVQVGGRLSWSPDGERLACGAWSGEIFVLDAATGATVLRYEGHIKPVLVMSWSPDGAQLASGDRVGTVKLWDATTGKAVHTLPGHTRAVRCFSWHPRDKRLASASWDNTVKVWDAAAGKELHTFKGHAGPVWCVSWSPDGKRLASAGKEGTVEIWSGETYAELFEIEGHPNRIASVDWSPDGKQLATSGGDQSVRVWDAATGRQIAMLQGHRAHVWSVEWSPDGKRLASCAGDNTVKVWDLSMKDRSREYPAGEPDVRVVRWSPDGTRLATGGGGDVANLASESGAVRWWRGRGGADPVVLMKPGQRYVSDLSWDPRGTRLAAGCTDGTIRIWDTDTARLLHTIAAHTGWAISVCWSPDGAQLASASSDRSIRIWDAATGVQRLAVAQDSKFKNLPLHWSADGARLISGGASGPITVWDAVRGRNLGILGEQREGAGSIAWSPDGNRLASARFDQKVELWDLHTDETKILRGHTDRVISVCWSPDGTRVASASSDRTVRVWDTATGKQVLVLEGKCRWLHGIDWSGDGKRIVACGFGDKVTVWDATIGYRGEQDRLDRQRGATSAPTRPAGNGQK